MNNNTIGIGGRAFALQLEMGADFYMDSKMCVCRANLDLDDYLLFCWADFGSSLFLCLLDELVLAHGVSPQVEDVEAGLKRVQKYSRGPLQTLLDVDVSQIFAFLVENLKCDNRKKSF